eukprot:CAMPEP_0170208696 /NCGR_PEP_ID=MMETSP0116_2-20130129/3934_1 /TAXON_ID=400756 /ORGANISM="Durinskia baltica, Strain CSIRO CS-38" /LENGTH=319 /DNA_ID=CAMNT_0010459171 /DNA_START=140 /DNA_END=1099 /DNA_ORIENTATION=+
MALGASLVCLNKFLLATERFPHAAALTALHMAMTSIMCCVLLVLQPSLFPGILVARDAYPGWFRRFVPIAMLHAASLITSNVAYSYCSISLLQFLKQGSMVIVFAFSCMLGTRRGSSVHMALLVWIMSAAILTISGDANFSPTGVAIQLISQASSALAVVMSELLLTSGTHRPDPLTFNLLYAPTTLAILLMCTVQTGSHQVIVDLLLCWRLLLLSAVFAGFLNITAAYLIREVSAVGLVLVDIVKDLSLAVVAAAMLGERILARQWAFFGLTLLGVGAWSWLNAYPSSFMLPRPAWLSSERPLVKNPRAGEQTPLVGA